MEQDRGDRGRHAKLCCPICLDLMEEPVSLHCGHSYCKGCIRTHWDHRDVEGNHSCPQCRMTFAPRPELEKNVILADLVEELKRTTLDEGCYAGDEDVGCDICTGRQRKALKSCSVCLASYCEKHLRPHFHSPSFQTHKLVEPSTKLRENICTRHNEVMKMFCSTDQRCICYLCPVDEHKGHETVSAAVERTERQRALESEWQKVKLRLQERTKEVSALQEKVQAINCSADKAVESSEWISSELIRLVQTRVSEVTWQIRSQQQSEVGRVTEVLQKLESEVAELQGKDAELERLIHTEDHVQFLQCCTSLSTLGESTPTPSLKVDPPKDFEDMTAAVSQLRGQLQDILDQKWTKISRPVSPVDVILSKPELKTGSDFLEYSREITLDPNTAHAHLLLSEGNRKVAFVKPAQSQPQHPDRFTGWWQVLGEEALTGRCYWEVEMSGRVDVAVAYKSVGRAGWTDECRFGFNKKSWRLSCDGHNYDFCHNTHKTAVSGPHSSRVGVYLDHGAGLLSFYSVTDKTSTLLHSVHTTLTQPLYAGVATYHESTAQFCKLT